MSEAQPETKYNDIRLKILHDTRISEQIAKQLSIVKLLVMDVDGTLTDGAMYYSANGEELKRFSTRDGMGVTLLHRSGIQTAIITSENSAIVSARAKKLGISHVQLGCRNKKAGILELSENIGIPLTEIAYIGDDVNDEQPIKLCGVSACPHDASAVIRACAHIVLHNTGGNGAVREFSEMILVSQGLPISLPESF